MKKLIIISVLLFGYFIQAQEVAGTTDLEELDVRKNNTEIYNAVEKPAYFPKGSLFFRQKFARNFKEKNVISNGIEKCELTFVIERDGTLTDIKASGTNQSFNKEAIRAVSKIKTKWIPAELDGHKVRYRFRVPLTINFK
ncbi:energy transducer TonB [Chryseobacterium indoltheticum]|uniref:energy transducer TonB n=1 Tax=Chryseobacterium indoltheticum TaxID=254 RepID=UPI001913CCDF|nr:energy transducer TonB [Chryseobacterium indoltheticum]QQQ27058.1 energy transducer TonB [Chryseobacterium indoltheticum]